METEMHRMIIEMRKDGSSTSIWHVSATFEYNTRVKDMASKYLNDTIKFDFSCKSPSSGITLTTY
jgi:hypothetical protein